VVSLRRLTQNKMSDDDTDESESASFYKITAPEWMQPCFA
jgi:hypothetical protein